MRLIIPRKFGVWNNDREIRSGYRSIRDLKRVTEFSDPLVPRR